MFLYIAGKVLLGIIFKKKIAKFSYKIYIIEDQIFRLFNQEHLEHRQCTICREAWLTRLNLTLEMYICYRCKRGMQEIT